MKKRKSNWIPAFAGMTFLLMGASLLQGASYRPVLEQERGFVGATHVATFTYADMTETNVDTPQTNSTVFTVKAKQRVELIGMELVTAFNAGDNATGSVCVIVGDGSDPDFYLDSTELDSNKTEVWSKFGRAYQGVTTATSTNMTNVALSTATVLAGVTVASEIDCLDSVTPSVAPAGTNVATTTKSATTNVTTTAQAFGTNVATTTKSATTNVTYTTIDITNVVDGVTNIFTVLATVTAQNDDVLASATLETADGLTGVTAQNDDVLASATLETGDFMTSITSNVVQAAKTLGTTTDDVVDGVTIQAESQTRVTALTDSATGRKVYTADDAIDFVFTPNSENALSENTAGEVRFYFKVIR
ncbi:MAG: hypothetical protein WC359_12575 [Dehalococcoidia bacterium]|jgi:hypothetical protein